MHPERVKSVLFPPPPTSHPAFHFILLKYKMEFLCSKHHSNNICILQAVSDNIVIFFCVHMEAIGLSLWAIHYPEIIFSDRI